MNHRIAGLTSRHPLLPVLVLVTLLPILLPKATAQPTGYALDFNTVSNNYVSLNLAAAPATNYTLTAWVLLRSSGTFNGTRMAVLGGPACDTSIELLIRPQEDVTTAPQYLELGRCDSFNGTRSTTAVPLSTWTHLAATVSSNKVVSYFINGLPAGSWTNAVGDFSLNSTVNLADNNGGRAFDGRLNNVQIWNRVLTAAEIQSNQNQSLTGSESGLLAWYPFREGSGNTTANAATNTLASAGTLVNHPLWVEALAPGITGVSPATGPTAGGTTNTLTGINFGTNGSVTVGGVAAAVVAWSQTNIQFVLPAGQGINLLVVVTVAGQTSPAALFSYAGPSISTVSPNTGPTAGGITNTLAGINFGTSGSVTVGSATAAVVAWSQTNIQFVLPAGQGVNLPVVVTVAGQTSPAAWFSYAGPSISTVSPNTGPTAGGITNTLAGINFGISGTVTIGGTAAAVVAWSQTNIQFILPAGQGINLPVVVTVVGQTSLAALFSYAGPSISTVSPNTGPTAGGITNTLTGINFGTSGTVTLGIATAAVVAWSQTNIQFVLPAGQGVNLPVVVTVVGQTSPAAWFSYAGPSISTVSPNTGPTAGGITNTLTGINFGTSGTVTIGGTAAAVVAWSQTNIQFILPAGQGANQPVVVTVAGQTSPADLFTFTYNPPVIIALSPTSGPTAGGTLITLTGTDFGTGGMVLIGNSGANNRTWSDSQIQCLAPAGVGELLSVTAVVGGQSSNPRFFSYVRPALSINAGTHAVTLTWPTNAPDYVLEEAGTVSGASWTQLAPVLTTNASNFNTVILSTNYGAVFRLRRP